MATTSTFTSALEPSATPTPGVSDDTPTVHHASPVVAFIIGLSIILLASVLNAAGLNLTKLDHVRMLKVKPMLEQSIEAIAGADE
jgi:magnesium transporter